jgi:hypothetical protein
MESLTLSKTQPDWGHSQFPRPNQTAGTHTLQDPTGLDALTLSKTQLGRLGDLTLSKTQPDWMLSHSPRPSCSD